MPLVGGGGWGARVRNPGRAVEPEPTEGGGAWPAPAIFRGGSTPPLVTEGPAGARGGSGACGGRGGGESIAAGVGGFWGAGGRVAGAGGTGRLLRLRTPPPSVRGPLAFMFAGTTFWGVAGEASSGGSSTTTSGTGTISGSGITSTEGSGTSTTGGATSATTGRAGVAAGRVGAGLTVFGKVLTELSSFAAAGIADLVGAAGAGVEPGFGPRFARSFSASTCSLLKPLSWFVTPAKPKSFAIETRSLLPSVSSLASSKTRTFLSFSFVCGFDKRCSLVEVRLAPQNRPRPVADRAGS